MLGALVISPDAVVPRNDEASPVPEHEPAVAETWHLPARSLAQLESSQKAMRDATKWLVAATGAVGAIVVAGLQLKDLPHGTRATVMALAGVIAALAAVAFILFSAADVLAAGYTTFGNILDLTNDHKYKRQQRKAHKWAERLRPYRKMRELPTAQAKGLEKAWQTVQSWYATVVIWEMVVVRKLTLHHARDEDVRIDQLIYLLDQDTFYSTQGLADTVTGLKRRLRDTDKEILSIRGEKAAGSEEDEDEEDDEEGEEESGGGNDSDPAKIEARADAALTAGEAVKTSAGPPPAPIKKTNPGTTTSAQVYDRQTLLEKASWRQERLESATGVLIALANQQVLQQKFRRLILAIIFGGAVVAFGAGSFALAPKFGKPQPLTITQPTQVSITLIGNGLSKSCPPGIQLKGVAVGGNWQEPIVVIEPSGRCPAQQVTLNPGQAVAVPVPAASS